MTLDATPFHSGELTAQRNVGVEREASATAGFIRDHMLEQHRAFFSALPFLVIAGADELGRRWVTIFETAEGKAASPDPRHLNLPGTLPAEDPLASEFTSGSQVGLLGIDLRTRRRNRLNGRMSADAKGLGLAVTQSFGNCPQYIEERILVRTDAPEPPGAAEAGSALSAKQTAWILEADTFFIGTGFAAGDDEGFDASHRGGAPGFVEVDAPNQLRFPDYLGNNYFNTIGNLVRDPRVGLVFVDFSTGGLLHVSGRAKIVWHGRNSRDPQARREIVVTVERVLERPTALTLRWSRRRALCRLRIAEKVHECAGIDSFHLEAADGSPLPEFVAGQHLPIALDVPGVKGPVRRSYSLSGSPSADRLRISVKRETHGIASTFFHDRLVPGDEIEAGPPSGDFILRKGALPVVLVSAGVGVTPMLAMLHELVEKSSNRLVWFVHGVRDGGSHAFRDEVMQLTDGAAAVTVKTFYSAPRPQDRPLPTGVAEGRIRACDLYALGAGREADYMLCGPTRFTADLSHGLERLGIPSGRIHHETFGPAS